MVTKMKSEAWERGQDNLGAEERSRQFGLQVHLQPPILVMQGEQGNGSGGVSQMKEAEPH